MRAVELLILPRGKIRKKLLFPHRQDVGKRTFCVIDTDHFLLTKLELATLKKRYVVDSRVQLLYYVVPLLLIIARRYYYVILVLTFLERLVNV